ncbi:hypothetical protein [Marinobacter orientalis]|uniref:Bacterial virulence factor lipase N-terminal domain-containing protein n=1 Tax=Marinobacter orientalis TaxID=1928859 RepID=A0A7Y0RBW1_9GAMM|nr:hypothetical protein [Marinobacter orientalis]NMT63392.1 hypothetical protein [Marinobacter orientalis]TGX48460.1 hypothetical protein DIT72_13750 [Marinobacter orientalis]
MLKKTLISLAVASSVGLTGCFDSAGSGSKNANPSPQITNPDFTGKTWPVFNPLTSELPVPTDLQFAQGAGADGTLNGSDENAITNALDFMDGSSTTAQFDIKLSASVDPNTLNYTSVIEGAGGAPAPNPQQNVFLLSLDFPGGDSLLNNGSHYTKLINELVEEGEIPAPERTSFPGETPTFDLGLAFRAAQQNPSPETAGAVFDFNNEFRAEIVSLDGGTDNVLRITPLRPLDPKKKYLVVVTNEIEDDAGDPIVGSPSYQNISNPDEPLGNAALAPVRGAIQGWESLATGYFNALTNNSREAAGLPPLTADSLALTLTFTTGGTEDVLEAATSPAQFFYKNSIVSTRQEAIAKYLAANADTFEQLDPSQQYGTLAQVAGQAVGEAESVSPTLKERAAGTEASLATNGADFSNPTPRDINLIEDTRIAASDALGESANPGQIIQAGIQLPYYLPVPTATDPSNLNATWKASTTVGGIIDAGAGNDPGTTPPSDKITYRYPFAGQQDIVFVPLMLSVPDEATTACAGPYDVVIYQHGIFGNRSHSLALGNQLAGSCYITVAMDLPMHGIAPKLATGELDPSLPFSVDVVQQQDGTFADSPLPMNERHFGWGQTATGDPARMQYSTEVEEAVGSSAQFFLNLSNLPAARDNNRQGVVDLLNLNASLVNLNLLDIDGNGFVDDVDVQLDGTGQSKVYYVGHSLGGILGTSLVTLVNDAAQEATIGNSNLIPFTAAAFVAPGAGIAKLLENSQSIAPRILAGLGQSGLTQGTSNLELFFNVAQASLDSVEPHNFAGSLVVGGTQLYLNEIYGDGTNRSTQDRTVPVAADVAYAGDYTAPLGMALPAPLAGTEPLIMQLEATTIAGNATEATVAGAGANVVRFEAGTHNTIIQPEDQAGTAVFADMATNIISFFASDGGSIGFNNANFVKDNEPTPQNP